MKKQFLLLTVLLFLLGACAPKPAEHSFIKVNADGQFVRDGKPYYFVGANFWYGAILGSEGEGGNRERLHKELDFLKSIGINNLRVLVGADGENGIKTRVEPSLQVAPGVYNDTILAGPLQVNGIATAPFPGIVQIEDSCHITFTQFIHKIIQSG